MTTIPYLPADLTEVPSYDPNRPEWRQEWFTWRDRVIQFRGDWNAYLEEHPELIASELARCAASFSYWLTMWGWIEEPRRIKGESPVKFYIPFPFQVDLGDWALARLDDDDVPDGFVSKARGLGASWIFAALLLWGWLFLHPWRARILSRKEDLVDKPLDMDSLFGKIDFMLKRLPPWQLPHGFQHTGGPGSHRLSKMLSNPANGNQIAGESTSTRSMRGARATLAVYDESAFIPGFNEVFATGTGTTNHRFAVSSDSFSEGRHFYDMWHTAQNPKLGGHPDAVRELDWWLNPYQDELWAERTKARFEREGNPYEFDRDYGRNPYAGASDMVYQQVETLPIIDDVVFDPTKPLIIGLDPGHADDTALVFAQQHEHADGRRGLVFLDSLERDKQPATFFAHILTGLPFDPEDECFGTALTPYEVTVMQMMVSLPWQGDLQPRIFMDPAGSQKHAGYSFFDMMQAKAKLLRDRERARRLAAGEDPDRVPRSVAPRVLYQAISGERSTHHGRSSAARKILNASAFANTRGGRRVRECLRNYQFSSPGDKATNEPKPLHNEYSHIVSAVEYMSVYVDLGLADPPKKAPKAPTRAVRRTLALSRRAA